MYFWGGFSAEFELQLAIAVADRFSFWAPRGGRTPSAPPLTSCLRALDRSRADTVLSSSPLHSFLSLAFLLHSQEQQQLGATLPSPAKIHGHQRTEL
jgi:hypothetical protein